MPRLCVPGLCTGCGACVNACPRGCIYMEADEEGFLYPKTNNAVCVDCGLCSVACPVLAAPKEETPGFPLAYAAHNRDGEVVKFSSSGGVFSALAQAFLTQGGVAYGAAFREDLSIGHYRAESVEGSLAFRGSKYVQSDVGLSYSQARKDLREGKKVLFSGTPCQIAALRSFLGKDYDGLVCVDIICHSVPSLRVWQTYLRETERQTGGKVISANFRDKRDGWKDYYLCTGLTDNGEDLRRGNDNYYMRAFIQGLSTRPSCHRCKFKGQNRFSDITLGDFWGVETACSKAFHKQGTSLVLLQSEKGKAIFNKVVPQLEVCRVDPAAAIQGNPAYCAHSKPHGKRGEFFRLLGQEPMEELTERLLSPTKWEIWKQRWSRSLIWRGIQKIRRML